MPKVTLIFADGERKEFEASADEPIMAAARTAGVSLASDCEIGDCQTCRAHLKSGRIVFDEYALLSLTKSDIAAGAVLTCVAMAQEDVEIEVPYARSALIGEKKYTMTVSRVETLSPTTALLRGELSPGSTFTFHPGQYVNIDVPESGVVRSYSMASSPQRPSELEFHIRLLRDGKMSKFIQRRNVEGTSIEIAGPKGVFYLRESNDPIVMVAGGTGLAPMVSMLHAVAHGDRAELPILLCYGVNRADDLYGVCQLKKFSTLLPNLEVRMAMVDPHTTWSGHKGFVTDLIGEADVTNPTKIYLCGPPPMITAARNRLAQFGVMGDSVFAEEFAPSGSMNA